MLAIRAYNLSVGLVFMQPDGTVWCVTHVTRNLDAETTAVWARRVEMDVESAILMPFMFGFNETVRVVGNIVNPHDPDDTDWGRD